METFETFIASTVNANLWKVIPFLLLAAGIYFGIRTLVVQLRLVPDMFKSVVDKPIARSADHETADSARNTPTRDTAGTVAAEKTDAQGVSAFKAFTISAAARVGSGNIAGVALAITVGGPGAVFWMWVIAIVGGATAFVESTLSQLYKSKDSEGNYLGGPAYYMTRGLNFAPLAAIFAVAITFTYAFVYNAIQANTFADALGTSMGKDSTSLHIFVGLGLAALTAAVIFGGVQRIANFTQVIVPVMAMLYILIGLWVVLSHLGEVPGVLSLIVGHALGLREVAGAAMGMAFTYGMQRGLFSNEAGQGSAPNAAATASVSHPVKQGLVQTLGVYFDTLLVCSITAFIILLANPTFGDTEAEGVTLTQTALSSEVGDWGLHLVTLILFFLAFSSIIGNFYLAQANVQYLTKSKVVLNIFRGLVLFAVLGGSVGSLTLVWHLGDTFAAIMVIINLIAIVPLAGVAVQLLRNYSQQKAKGVDPVFHRDMLPELKNIECWDGSDPVTRRGGRAVTEI